MPTGQVCCQSCYCISGQTCAADNKCRSAGGGSGEDDFNSTALLATTTTRTRGATTASFDDSTTATDDGATEAASGMRAGRLIREAIGARFSLWNACKAMCHGSINSQSIYNQNVKPSHLHHACCQRRDSQPLIRNAKLFVDDSAVQCATESNAPPSPCARQCDPNM